MLYPTQTSKIFLQTRKICSSGSEIIITVGSDTKVAIPSTINDLPVKEIGDRVFLNCSNLNIVVIPNSVMRINTGTFYNCYNLECVYIQESWSDDAIKKFLEKIRILEFCGRFKILENT